MGGTVPGFCPGRVPPIPDIAKTRRVQPTKGLNPITRLESIHYTHFSMGSTQYRVSLDRFEGVKSLEQLDIFINTVGTEEHTPRNGRISARLGIHARGARFLEGLTCGFSPGFFERRKHK